MQIVECLGYQAAAELPNGVHVELLIREEVDLEIGKSDLSARAHLQLGDASCAARPRPHPMSVTTTLLTLA